MASACGAEVPFMRPKELAADSSAEWLAWRHAIDFLYAQGVEFDRFVSLPATSPLRSVDDVENCIEALDNETDIVVTVKKAERSPFFNMVTIGDDGLSRLAMTSDEKVSRRQDAPLVFDMTTVCYVTRPNFVLERSGIFQGNVRSVIVPEERAIDIDNPIDFKLAELLVNELR